MWLICSNRMLYHKRRSFCYRDTTQQSFLSDHLHCINRPLTSVLRKDILTLHRRLKRTPFRKNVLNEISHESNFRPAQLRKFEGSNYQHNFAAGRQSLFHFDVEISL